jgi:hypothetical protein
MLTGGGIVLLALLLIFPKEEPNAESLSSKASTTRVGSDASYNAEAT